MSNKTPKEIYINNQWMNSFYCKISKKFASTEKLEDEQVKYLSEEHFNSLIEQKDKKIEILNRRINGYLDIIDRGGNTTLDLFYENGKLKEEIERLKNIAMAYIRNNKKKSITK